MLHLSERHSGRQFSKAQTYNTKHLRNDESFEELRSKSNSQVAEVAEFIEQKELACSLRKVQVSRASKQWKGDNEPQYQSLVVRLSEASPL